MATQNRFKTGLDIAKYTAAIIERDGKLRCDSSQYT
jgi:isocitrate lyase